MRANRKWFWHWQNLQDGAPWWKYGRAWCHLDSNTIGIEWLAGTRRCGASVEFSTTSAKSILIYIGIPWLIALYFSVTGLRWVRHLPGVDYTGWMTGSREISIGVSDWTIRCALWSYSNVYPHRHFHFCVDDFLLGRQKYSEFDHESGETEIVFPEKVYTAKYTLFTSEWRRPRWPWPRQMRRGHLEIVDGVPVPGKGENSWDMDDDAITSMTAPARSVAELIGEFRRSVEQDRERHGGTDWSPA